MVVERETCGNIVRRKRRQEQMATTSRLRLSTPEDPSPPTPLPASGARGGNAPLTPTPRPGGARGEHPPAFLAARRQPRILLKERPSQPFPAWLSRPLPPAPRNP